MVLQHVLPTPASAHRTYPGGGGGAFHVEPIKMDKMEHGLQWHSSIAAVGVVMSNLGLAQ